MTHLLEFTAALFGVLGTLLLATKGPKAGWGFVAYLVSNLCWIAFGWKHMHKWLIAQHVAFLASSFVGIWYWLLMDRVTARIDRLFAPWDGDREAREQAICRRFDGRNARQLAAEFDMPLADVHDLVYRRGARP